MNDHSPMSSHIASDEPLASSVRDHPHQHHHHHHHFHRDGDSSLSSHSATDGQQLAVPQSSGAGSEAMTTATGSGSSNGGSGSGNGIHSSSHSHAHGNHIGKAAFGAQVASPSEVSLAPEMDLGPKTSTGASVLIKCPSPDALEEPIPDQRIPLDAISSGAPPLLSHLKGYICKNWPGKPTGSGLRFIRNGRLCVDTDPVGDGSEEQREITLHLVIRSDAWTERASIAGRTHDMKSGSITPRLAPATPSLIARRIVSPSISRSPSRQDDEPSTSTSYFAEPTGHVMVDYARLRSKLHTKLEYGRLFPISFRVSAEHGPISFQDRLDHRDEQIHTLQDLLTSSYAVWLERYESVWEELLAEESKKDERNQKMLLSANVRVAAACAFVEDHVFCLPPPPVKPITKRRPQKVAESDFEEVTVEINSRLHSLRYPSHGWYNDRVAYLTRIIEERLRPLDMLRGELEAYVERNKEGFAMRALLEYGLAPSAAPAPVAAQQQPTPQALRARAVLARQANMQQAFDTTLPALLRALPAILFLAFRVAILLWVFVKDMRGFKQYALLSITAAWYCWQVVYLVKRQRARLRRDRWRQNNQLTPEQLQQFQRRRAEELRVRAEQQARGPYPPEEAENGPEIQGDAADRDASPSPPPFAPYRYTVESPLHWQWWIEHLAYFGMQEEDAELGFRLRGRQARNRGAPRPRATLFSSLVTFVVLFIGTMIPEVEVRRRSAVIDREGLILKCAKQESERKERVRVAREEEEARETSTAVDEASDSEEKSEIRFRGSRVAPAPMQDGEAAVEEEEFDPVDALIQDEMGPALLRTTYAARLMRKMYRPMAPIPGGTDVPVAAHQDAPAGEAAPVAEPAPAAAEVEEEEAPDADEQPREAEAMEEEGEGDWAGEDDFGFF